MRSGAKNHSTVSDLSIFQERFSYGMKTPQKSEYELTLFSKLLIGVMAISIISYGGYKLATNFGWIKMAPTKTHQVVLSQGKKAKPSSNKPSSPNLSSNTTKASSTTASSNVKSTIPSSSEITNKIPSEAELKAQQVDVMTAVAMARMSFEQLKNLEGKSDADLQKLKDITLHELAYEFMWYAQQPQYANQDAHVESAEKGLARLAKVYQRAHKKAPFDLTDGVKVTASNFEQYKPKNWDDRLKKSYNTIKEQVASTAASSQTKATQTGGAEPLG